MFVDHRQRRRLTGLGKSNHVQRLACRPEQMRSTWSVLQTEWRVACKSDCVRDGRYDSNRISKRAFDPKLEEELAIANVKQETEESK